MDLNFNTELVKQYHSSSQIARILTENWFEVNMFCPRCGATHLNRFENNRPVADFYCPVCKSEYELKSKSGSISRKINDGAYETMIQRITHNNNPDLFCLNYLKAEHKVVDLIFIPKYFFTPNIIEKRKPLSAGARRAGWTGCNILLDKIPFQARIPIIADSKVCNIGEVVNSVKRCDAAATSNLVARGWLLDILNCVNSLDSQEFSLSDVYRFEDDLSLLHPGNNNIKPKIRQQLQFLRDKGFIEFLGGGKYRKI